MDNEKRPIPRITLGEYAGTPIDQLPVSYCRWMLTKKFPREWLEIARAKVEASPIHNDRLWVSRHALDRYSVYFLKRWTEHKVSRGKDSYDGFATFVVKQAKEAWENGEDISKKRYKNDGIVKFYKGVKYVFNQGKQFPEYLELITVM